MQTQELMTRPNAAAPEAAPIALRRPRTRVRETEEALIVTLELPGVSEEGLELVREGHPSEGQVLRVLGRRGRLEEVEGFAKRLDEIQPGDFEHRFRLSPKLDLEGIAARLSHGVLEVTLPRRQPEQTRIPIQTGG